jgi:5-methylcytosine-specific restriction endonuclease McrA
MEIFRRDRFTCTKCGIHSGCGHVVVLNADHIKPFSLYPELRCDVSNGRTLCLDCHRKTETYGGRFRHQVEKEKKENLNAI